MKKSLIIGSIIILLLSSCDDNNYHYYTPTEESNDEINPEVFFCISGVGDYMYSDIELYDSSTHILYFKTAHEEFSNLLSNSFVFLDNGDTIYSGGFWPAYFSSMPRGPYIMSAPIMYPNYALRIDYINMGSPDVRNCPGFIDVILAHNLLHPGLEISIDTIIINDIILTFNFSVVNNDQTDLLILDINKTGPNLFHYFTNGLYIRDADHSNIFSSNITHFTPSPWNGWKIEWLTEIKSGASVQFTIIDTINTQINPGEYTASFEFPGLAYQVTRDQLYQDNKRIWLGDIQGIKKIIN